MALFALVLGAGLGSAAPDEARAQLDPRAAQAIAICNSPAGALITECQQLKALTTLAGPQVVTGMQGSATAAQLAYAACVQAAGINQAALQACNSRLYSTLGLPQPQAGPYTQYDRNTNTAMNIYSGAAGYQQCIAAMMAAGHQAGGINPCTPLLSGNPAGAGAPAGFGAPQAYSPQAYNPPAPIPAPPPAKPLDPLAPANKPFDPLGF